MLGRPDPCATIDAASIRRTPLDALHFLIFLLSAALAAAAAFGMAAGLLPALNTLVRVAFAAGVAGMLIGLSAGFAGLVALFGIGSALLVARRDAGAFGPSRGPAVVALVCAAITALVLAYVGFRSDFHDGAYPGGSIGGAALGRLLFERDALAFEALAAIVLLCAVEFTSVEVTRRRRR